MELNVLAPDGEVFSYDSDLLIRGDFKVSETLSSDGEIELSDVELALPELFGLSGLSGYEALPDDEERGYRARLQGPDGDDVLDGLIYLDHVDFDDATQNFGMTLVSGTAQQLWQRLEEVPLQTMGLDGRAFLEREQPNAVVEDQQDYHESVLASPSYNEDWYTTYISNPTWYELASLVRGCLAETDAREDGGITFDVPPLWQMTVPYPAADGTTQVLRYPASIYMTCQYDPSDSGGAGEDIHIPTLPDWTCRRLVEEVKALAGWKLRASFTTFPLRDIHVEMIPDTQPPGLTVSDVPGLDARRLEGSHGVRRKRPDEEDFALKYANPIGDASYKRLPRRVSSSPIAWRYAPPPAWAGYAPTSWKTREPQERVGEGGAKRLEDPREPDNETVRDVPFHLAHVAHYTDMSELTRFPFPNPPDPYLREIVYYGAPFLPKDVGGCYLASLIDISGDTEPPNWKAVHHRKAVDGNGLFGRLYNEVWARSAYEGQRLSRRLRYERDGAYDVRGLDVEVGIPDQGVAAKGRAWMVRDIERRPKTGGARLLLSHPLEDPAPAAALPRRVGLVTNLEVRWKREEVDAGGEYLAVQWDPPLAREGRALKYEVEREITDDQGNTSWAAMGEPWGTNEYQRWQTVSSGTYTFRVRALGPDGQTGAWKETEFEFEHP